MGLKWFRGDVYDYMSLGDIWKEADGTVQTVVEYKGELYRIFLNVISLEEWNKLGVTDKKKHLFPFEKGSMSSFRKIEIKNDQAIQK